MDEQERSRLDATAESDDSISLRPYLEALRRYRRVIYVAVGAVSVIFVAGVLAMVVLYPSERVASVRFRLLFDGAALGQYPNGNPFSPMEIVAAPIVTEVFKANDLQKYGSYEDFKNTLFIQQSNAELDQLAEQYRSILADPRLNAADRSRIEAEFASKRAAVTDPSFALSLQRREFLNTLPGDLAEKVLNDTLATWAVQAERMGAMKYQVPILSGLVLSKESFDREDYLVAIDELRAKVVRLIESVSELEKVPGAMMARTSRDGVSLPEIRANIDDVLRFDLEPLLGIIRSEGVTKDAALLRLYVSTQVFQRQIERQAADARARAVQASLTDYAAQRDVRMAPVARPDVSGSAKSREVDTPALIPQFSESFLNRLVEMSAAGQKADTDYRQKLTDMIIAEKFRVSELDQELTYYQALAASLQGLGSRSVGSAEAVNLVKARGQAAFSAIEKSANQLVDLYNEQSAKNLNPAARLYATVSPFTERTLRSLSYRSVVLSFVLMLVLTLILTTTGCFIHAAIQRRSAG